MRRILTIGEALAEFIAMEPGDLRSVETFKRRAGGVELTYAVGMARLGYEVDFVTRVGNDALGLYLLDFLKQNNVNTEYINIIDNYPTAIALKDSNPGEWPEMHYYRKSTAGSTLDLKDVDRINFEHIDHLHITGIAISLSTSARKAVMQLIDEAHQRDITVSFDPNIRPQLWADEVEMKKIINGISILCDIIFPEELEAQKLLGTSDPDSIADFYLGAGVKTVVLKSGDKGIFVKNKKERFWAEPYPIVNPVDMMGAGEGFVVGVTSAIMEGRSLRHAIERGRIVAAEVVKQETSYAGMPDRNKLIELIENHYGKTLKEILADNFPVPKPTLNNEVDDETLRKRMHDQMDPESKHRSEENVEDTEL